MVGWLLGALGLTIVKQRGKRELISLIGWWCVELKRWVKLRSFLDQVGVKGVCFCMFVYAWVAKRSSGWNKHTPNLEETKMPSKTMQYLGQGEGCRLVRWLFKWHSEGSVQHLFYHPHPFFPWRKSHFIYGCVWFPFCELEGVEWYYNIPKEANHKHGSWNRKRWKHDVGTMARIQENNESSRSRLASLLRMWMFVLPHAFHRFVLTV